MRTGLKNRLAACILILVIAGLGTVIGGDVIVKEGRIGTGNTSPSPNAKLFVSDNATDTTNGYGLVTIATNSNSGTQNNRGFLCEFYPDASDTTYNKTAGTFFNFPVGTEGTESTKIYYALFGNTSPKENAFTINNKTVHLYGIGFSVQNPNHVTGGDGYVPKLYKTCGINVYSQPVNHGYTMGGENKKLNIKNYGICVTAQLDGSYQLTG